MKHTVFLLLIAMSIAACRNKDDADSDETLGKSPNILFIIADDMGLDATSGYAEGEIKPKTPHIDSMMNSGLRFTRFWTNPLCSPTRATILTGKYGHRTNVLSPSDPISSSEMTLQSYISQKTNGKYATSLIGKWHLSGSNNTFNPEVMGIDYYAGLLSGAVQSYYSWNLVEDGTASRQTEYVTTKLTDLAIDWIHGQTKPWFLWLAYTASHTPFHVPPETMHSQGSLNEDQSAIDANSLPYYIAAIEAMDYQIGKLLNTLTAEEKENTIVIFIGDNGTPAKVAQSPYTRRKAKGSLYQGGVNCPLLMTGPGITRTGTTPALINSTDLFATIASLAGVEVEEINDSKNFAALLSSGDYSPREFVYSELESQWCIGDESYKLIQSEDGAQELYNLQTDPYETSNLLNATLSTDALQAKDRLEQLLTNVRK